MTKIDRGNPPADPTNLYVNHHSKVWFEVRACTKCLDPAAQYDPAHGGSCQVIVDSPAKKKKVIQELLGL